MEKVERNDWITEHVESGLIRRRLGILGRTDVELALDKYLADYYDGKEGNL